MTTTASDARLRDPRLIDGRCLARALGAASDRVRRFQSELNRINVFPVPDGDAGTNLTLTAQAIAHGVRPAEDGSLGDVATAAAEAAVMGARGNCGMLVAHYASGFAAGLEGLKKATTADIAKAMRSGARAVEHGLDNPVEGTILTVVRDVAAEAEALTRDDADAVRDVAAFLGQLVEAGRESVRRTPNLLSVLRRAGVVDAGGKGFVELLDGVFRYVTGDVEEAGESDEDATARLEEVLGIKLSTRKGASSPISALEEHVHSSRRYCTEILVEATDLPPNDDLRSSLRHGAEDLLLLRTGKLLKVHLHTDTPETALSYLRGLGNVVAHKAEDMYAQYQAAASSAGRVRRPTGVVVDSAADLPLAVRRAHGIHVVPILLVLDGNTLRDGVDIDAMAIHARIASGKSLPTTSPPPPGEFAEALQEAGRDYESLLVVVMASAMSGIYRSAKSAAQLLPGLDLHIVDSRGSSLLNGLLALKAAELAADSTLPAEVAVEIDRIRNQSGMLFTVRHLDQLRASGRISRFQGMIGGILDIKPIMRINQAGAIEPAGKGRGLAAARAALFEQIEAAVPSGATKLRFGVTHVGDPELAAELREELISRFGQVEILVAPAAATVSTHTGTGAWGIAFMVED